MKKTKLLYIFISVFFVFTLNPENAFSLALASQSAVNQSFAGKIPESKKEILKKKITHFVKKYFGEVKPKSKLDRWSLFFSISAIALISLAVYVGGALQLYLLAQTLAILCLVFCILGFTFGALFIARLELKDVNTKLDRAVWGIVLSTLPIIFFVLSLFLEF
jgi:hypothetical protein